MSNFEQLMPETPPNFPIGFPESCAECPSPYMGEMLGTWRFNVAVRNEVMGHNGANTGAPVIFSETLFNAILSSETHEEFINKMNNEGYLLEESAKTVAGIDEAISNIERCILDHTRQCTEDTGPVKVRLPAEIGGRVINFCSAELADPTLIPCDCGDPGCSHDKRISGIVID